MIPSWTAICTSVGDLLLGWTLRLPRDPALVMIAVVSAALLVMLRRAATNQSRLREIHADQRRQLQLLRQARNTWKTERQGKQDATWMQRWRQVRMMVGLLRFKEEGKAAALSLLPLAMLLTWMGGRFDYLPIEPGESFELRLEGPVIFSERPAHLVPVEGIVASGGWIQLLNRHPELSQAAAQWDLRLEQPGVDALTLRSGETSLRHQVLVNGLHGPPVQFHGAWTTRVALRRYRPAGLIGGLPEWGLPGWLLAYLGITVTTFFILKAMLRVA